MYKLSFVLWATFAVAWANAAIAGCGLSSRGGEPTPWLTASSWMSAAVSAVGFTICLLCLDAYMLRSSGDHLFVSAHATAIQTLDALGKAGIASCIVGVPAIALASWAIVSAPESRQLTARIVGVAMLGLLSPIYDIFIGVFEILGTIFQNLGMLAEADELAIVFFCLLAGAFVIFSVCGGGALMTWLVIRGQKRRVSERVSAGARIQGA